MKPMRTSGFTLVEMIVVAVVGSLLALAALTLLQTALRGSAIQNAKRSSQQDLRSALEVLGGEIREISAQGGDLMTISQDSFSFRALRTYGISCEMGYTGGDVQATVKRIAGWMEVGDSVMLFADNDSTTFVDDVWIPGRVSVVDTMSTCSGTDKAQIVRITTAPTSDSVRLGAPIRTFVPYTYGFFQVDGEYHLARHESGASAQALVGPLLSTGGLEFDYLDANGIATLVPALVAQIVVRIRTSTEVAAAGLPPVTDSLEATIFLRN